MHVNLIDSSEVPNEKQLAERIPSLLCNIARPSCEGRDLGTRLHVPQIRLFLFSATTKKFV